MKQIAILGLDSFGRAVLKELAALPQVELLVIDKDRDVIDQFKDSPVSAVGLDVLNQENLRRVLPEKLDAVIIDMGKHLEASILAASYCVKLNIPMVIAVAESEPHGEILALVGATDVIFPGKEAARRLTHQIMSEALLNYLVVNDSLAIAEQVIPPFLVGKALRASALREEFRLNLLFVRKEGGEFGLCGPDYVFQKGDIGLFAGDGAALTRLAGKDLSMKKEASSLLRNVFKLFRRG